MCCHAGCVMAEMLGMLDNPSNPDAALDREALFPGSSCYPVTGAAGNTILLKFDVRCGKPALIICATACCCCCCCFLVLLCHQCHLTLEAVVVASRTSCQSYSRSSARQTRQPLPRHAQRRYVHTSTHKHTHARVVTSNASPTHTHTHSHTPPLRSSNT